MAGKRFAVALGLVVMALALVSCGGDDEGAVATDTETTASGTPEPGDTLDASVGPGFEISLATEDGTPVEELPAGSYTLLTDDQSEMHNFHLTGEGVDVDTGVGETGTNSFDIEVTSGTYTFVCDPHASTMNGSFEVSG